MRCLEGGHTAAPLRVARLELGCPGVRELLELLDSQLAVAILQRGARSGRSAMHTWTRRWHVHHAPCRPSQTSSRPLHARPGPPGHRHRGQKAAGIHPRLGGHRRQHRPPASCSAGSSCSAGLRATWWLRERPPGHERRKQKDGEHAGQWTEACAGTLSGGPIDYGGGHTVSVDTAPSRKAG